MFLALKRGGGGTCAVEYETGTASLLKHAPTQVEIRLSPAFTENKRMICFLDMVVIFSTGLAGFFAYSLLHFHPSRLFLQVGFFALSNESPC